MRFGDIVAYSLKNLKQNKGRTIATMVGVVLGTLLVVLIVAIGNGANQSIMESMQQNTNLRLINVYPYYGSSNDTNTDPNQKHITKITDSVLKQIRHISGVEAVTPVVNAWLGMDATLVNGKYETYAQLTGVYVDDFAKITELTEGKHPVFSKNKMEFVMSPMSMVGIPRPGREKLRMGRRIHPAPERRGDTAAQHSVAQVAVHGTLHLLRLQQRHRLNPNPTQNSFDVDAKMTGILKQDKNDFSFSYGTYVDVKWLKQFVKDNKKLLNDLGTKPNLDNYDTVYVKAATIDEVSAVLEGLNELGVQYSSPMQWIDELKASTNKTQMFLMFIAMFTMLASIMSIYNTISMSVQERKREIGIMKVLGCRISEIRAMFLAEAMMIGFGGGLMGLLISVGFAQLINNVPIIGQMLGQLIGRLNLRRRRPERHHNPRPGPNGMGRRNSRLRPLRLHPRQPRNPTFCAGSYTIGGVRTGGNGRLRVLSFQEKRKNQRKADWLFSRKCFLVRTF